MLVLTRRIGQPIVILNPHTGDTYEVTVVDVRGDQVRLGISAPRHVTVDRAEIFQQKHPASLPANLPPAAAPK
jgi:carbon storage regulator